MAYFGTTAATSVSNPPVLLARSAGGRWQGAKQTSAWSSASTFPQGLGLWLYSSTNLSTDVTSAGFFSDGQSLGMQIGDVMFNVQATSAGSSFISAFGPLLTTNSSAGWNMSTGGNVTSTFRSS